MMRRAALVVFIAEAKQAWEEDQNLNEADKGHSAGAKARNSFCDGCGTTEVTP
jgi:hypothetical protein